MKSTQPQKTNIPIQQRKMNYKIVWGVNPFRIDKRTGPISPIQTSPYMQYALDEIHRQFHKE